MVGQMCRSLFIIVRPYARRAWRPAASFQFGLGIDRLSSIRAGSHITRFHHVGQRTLHTSEYWNSFEIPGFGVGSAGTS